MTFIKTVTILPVLISNAEQQEMFLVWILISYNSKTLGLQKYIIYSTDKSTNFEGWDLLTDTKLCFLKNYL